MQPSWPFLSHLLMFPACPASRPASWWPAPHQRRVGQRAQRHLLLVLLRSSTAAQPQALPGSTAAHSGECWAPLLDTCGLVVWHPWGPCCCTCEERGGRGWGQSQGCLHTVALVGPGTCGTERWCGSHAVLPTSHTLHFRQARPATFPTVCGITLGMRFIVVRYSHCSNGSMPSHTSSCVRAGNDVSHCQPSCHRPPL